MERRADPTTQLEVDEAILDYLSYSAIRALIHDYRTLGHEDGDRVKGRARSGAMLQLVDSFLTMFRFLHPAKRGTREIQFRLRLLRFTATFSSRFSFVTIKPSSRTTKSLRAQNRERRKAFGTAGYPAGIFVDGLANTTEREIQANDITTNLYGPRGPASLIDTLPSFMALSAAQSAVQELPVSDVWMRLAAGYMSHAALEQSLLHGMTLMDALKESFAWRFDPNSTAEEGTDEWAINTMFFGEDGEVDGWSDIRDGHIRAILPPEGVSLQSHAESLLANELLLDAFEESLMSFIEGLLNAHPKPLYSQLESGKIDDLSSEETQAIRRAFSVV